MDVNSNRQGDNCAVDDVSNDTADVRAALLADIEDMGRSRALSVSRGAETKELAGLLVQKYGYGLVKGAAAMARRMEMAAPLSYADVDSVVKSIDPDWIRSANDRWSLQPATIAVAAED